MEGIVGGTGGDARRSIVLVALLGWLRSELGELFPEKLAAVQDFSSAHVKLVLVVISEDVCVIAFHGGDALLLLQLFDGRNEVAIASGALELLRFGSLGHALAQGFDEVSLAAF